MPSDFQLFPEQASTIAADVDALYVFLVVLSAIFSLLIAGAVFYCAIRYRRRHPDEVGGTFHGSLALEITWSVIPLGIVLFVFAWGLEVFYDQNRAPAGALEFYVTGKQWMWKIQHPEGNREINALHVPIDQPVKLIMTSEDVLHDFFIPAFRIKKDVLPGRYTSIWFEATKAGVYHLFCAEYCGTEHSRMIGKVHALEPEAYQAWLAGGRPQLSLADAGEELFSKLACNTCHIDTATGRGPSLDGVYGLPVEVEGGRTVIADEGYLRESILEPTATMVAGYPALMPTYRGQVSEEQVIQLISYIKSLGAAPAEVGAESSPPGVTSEAVKESE